MAEDLIKALMQIYGDGYRNPATENYRADPHNELGGQFSTQDTMGHMAQRSAPSGLLNALADYIPANQEHSVSLVNSLRGGLGSAANWLDWKPETSDMLSPPGMGFMRGAGSSAARPTMAASELAVNSFDPSRVGQNTGSRAPGIFFSSDPAHASAAADLHAMRAEAPGSQRVIQAYIRPGRQGVIDLGGESGAGLPEVQRAIKRMRDEGYDSVVIKNTIEASGGKGSEIAVFHPSNIRTVDKDGPGLESLKAEGFDTSNIWHHGTGAWGPK